MNTSQEHESYDSALRDWLKYILLANRRDEPEPTYPITTLPKRDIISTKEKRIAELKNAKETYKTEISKLQEKISDLESKIRAIDKELIELLKKDPLEEFAKHIKNLEKEIEIDLSKPYSQFEKLFRDLNQENVQLNIDNVNGKFKLMVEGSDFSTTQKEKIASLKKLFKVFNTLSEMK